MDDYIRRADAIQALVGITAYNSVEEIQAACFDSYARANGWLGGVMESIAALAEGIPAADVRPVKEGHWVKARGSWVTPGGDPVWECSECGKGVHVYGIEHGTYGRDIADGQWVSCPNCGADMTGGADG